jgi:hypothetical protein
MVVGAETVSSIRKVVTLGIERKSGTFANIGKNYFGAFEYWVVCYVVLDFIPLVAAGLTSSTGARSPFWI